MQLFHTRVIFSRCSCFIDIKLAMILAQGVLCARKPLKEKYESEIRVNLSINESICQLPAQHSKSLPL